MDIPTLLSLETVGVECCFLVAGGRGDCWLVMLPVGANDLALGGRFPSCAGKGCLLMVRYGLNRGCMLAGVGLMSGGGGGCGIEYC